MRIPCKKTLNEKKGNEVPAAICEQPSTSKYAKAQNSVIVIHKIVKTTNKNKDDFIVSAYHEVIS